MPRHGAPGRRRADQLPGGRHGLSREAVAESQRERLLAAMTVAVGRRGYRDAHITEVVDRAGVSRRTFYEHFGGGKEECFAAAYQRSIDMLAMKTLGAERDVVRANRAVTDVTFGDPGRHLDYELR